MPNPDMMTTAVETKAVEEMLRLETLHTSIVVHTCSQLGSCIYVGGLISALSARAYTAMHLNAFWNALQSWWHLHVLADPLRHVRLDVQYLRFVRQQDQWSYLLRRRLLGCMLDRAQPKVLYKCYNKGHVGGIEGGKHSSDVAEKHIIAHLIGA